MAMILTFALLAITALAIPNPTNSILSRDVPPPKGVETDTDFVDNLEFRIYQAPGCHGDPLGVPKGYYGLYKPYQMMSYKLSRKLHDYEHLDFYAGRRMTLQVDHKFESSMIGNNVEACWVYDVRAGVNATTNDRLDDDGHVMQHGKNKGCHKLNNNEWCAVLWRELLT